MSFYFYWILGLIVSHPQQIKNSYQKIGILFLSIIFKFFILKCFKKNKINLYDESKPWATDEHNEKLLNWDNKELNLNALSSIKVLLPKEKNWSSTTEQFGNIDSTCLLISHSENEKCDICFRLDLRSLNFKIFLEILKFIHSHNAAIVYNNKCYEIENENVLLNLIANSNARKFCENPFDFLQKNKIEFN